MDQSKYDQIMDTVDTMQDELLKDIKNEMTNVLDDFKDWIQNANDELMDDFRSDIEARQQDFLEDFRDYLTNKIEVAMASMHNETSRLIHEAMQPDISGDRHFGEFDPWQGLTSNQVDMYVGSKHFVPDSEWELKQIYEQRFDGPTGDDGYSETFAGPDETYGYSGRDYDQDETYDYSGRGYSDDDDQDENSETQDNGTEHDGDFGIGASFGTLD